jgi:hypothetical protein
VIGSLLGLLLIAGYLGWLVWTKIAPPPPPAEASSPTAIAPSPEAVSLQPNVTESVESQIAPGQVVTAVATVDVSPLEPSQLAATATAHALYNRPAFANNPSAAPYFVGIISYEGGCPVTNLGFTTSGYNGEPFYLYLRAPLDRDPFFQIVQLSGYLQIIEECPHPVIFVEQLFWMGNQGTPSPLSQVTEISGTATITITATVPWGYYTDTGDGTLTASKPISQPLPLPPPRDIPGPETPIATYTPYPTYTPHPAPAEPAPAPTLKPLPTYTPLPVYPTYTPFPTFTPPPSPSPTATATPILSNLIGRVVTLPGCPVTNLGLDDQGALYYLILDGPSLPSDPAYIDRAVVQGYLETACGAQSIRAKSVTWYTVATTPTLTATTISSTPTATITPTAIITATEVLTNAP